MERTARGSVQMLACCSSAPAARTSQLGDCTEEQTPPTPPSALLLTFKFTDKRETNPQGPEESCSTRRHQAQSQIHCWQELHTSSTSSSGLIVGSEEKKSRLIWFPFIERVKEKGEDNVFRRIQKHGECRWSDSPPCIFWLIVTRLWLYSCVTCFVKLFLSTETTSSTLKPSCWSLSNWEWILFLTF